MTSRDDRRTASSPGAGDELASTSASELRDQVLRLGERLARERSARVEAEQITEDVTAALYATNRELEAFVRNVSHDLRTPVIALKGFSGILSSMLEEPSPDVREILERIQANASFLGEVLDDLLELSRVGREGGPGRTTDTDEVVRAAVADARQRYEGGTVDVEPGLPEVGIGPAALRRVLTNLVGNALAYGGDDVHVRVSSEVAEGVVHLVVADDGPGIAERDRGRVFEPFVRGASADRSSGTGLGLSISRRLCRHAGGDLVLLDREVGSSFDVQLPVADGQGEHRQGVG